MKRLLIIAIIILTALTVQAFEIDQGKDTLPKTDIHNHKDVTITPIPEFRFTNGPEIYELFRIWFDDKSQVQIQYGEGVTASDAVKAFFEQLKNYSPEPCICPACPDLWERLDGDHRDYNRLH